MRHVFTLCLAALLLVSAPSDVKADMETLSVTVSYRERIALPPGAELDVRIFDVSETRATATRLVSQRVAMTGVPMTVALTYDPQLVDAEGRYVVVAGIETRDGQPLFRTTGRHGVFGPSDPDSLDILLAMVPEAEAATMVPPRISGIPWTVTEVLGEAWEAADPATLVIDAEMNFSIFGGCNRFRGQLVLSDDSLVFPETFAGTLMACPDEIEARERGFIAALQQVSGYLRYGAGLVLTDAAGTAVMHFKATPE